MKIVAGQTAVLTGASGGLGTYIAHALADAGFNLALIAYPGLRLETLREAVETKALKAMALSADLREFSQYASIFDKLNCRFSAIDLLLNNAGEESTAA